MLVFVVNYKESERNTFQVFAPESPQVCEAYVDAPLIDHACGYVIKKGETQEWTFDGVPKLQRRLFCGSDDPQAFVTALQSEAKPLTAAMIEKLHADKRDYINLRRKEEKELMANTDTSKPKAAKKPAVKKAPKAANGGERAARFSPPDDSKIYLVENSEARARKETGAGGKNFALYKNGMTIAKFKELGGRPGFLKTDIAKGRVELRAKE